MRLPEWAELGSSRERCNCLPFDASQVVPQGVAKKPFLFLPLSVRKINKVAAELLWLGSLLQFTRSLSVIPRKSGGRRKA